jgi:multidrug efflux pump subunit AcrB
MWIVRLALRRPYTFVVVSVLIVILGIVSILRTPTDIFPNIDIPVVSSIWNYTGLSPADMTAPTEQLANRAAAILREHGARTSGRRDGPTVRYIE